MSAASPLLTRWRKLSRWPLGSTLFSRSIGWMAPYSGTIRPRVLELGPGKARVELRDRRRVRNHLRSVHAIALMNVAELASGLATLSGLPADARAILTGLRIEYRKKARGTLVAACEIDPPATSEEREIEVPSEIRDEAGDVVAAAVARWKIGPVPRGARPAREGE